MAPPPSPSATLRHRHVPQAAAVRGGSVDVSRGGSVGVAFSCTSACPQNKIGRKALFKKKKPQNKLAEKHCSIKKKPTCQRLLYSCEPGGLRRGVGPRARLRLGGAGGVPPPPPKKATERRSFDARGQQVGISCRRTDEGRLFEAEKSRIPR